MAHCNSTTAHFQLHVSRGLGCRWWLRRSSKFPGAVFLCRLCQPCTCEAFGGLRWTEVNRQSHNLPRGPVGWRPRLGDQVVESPAPACLMGEDVEV